MTESRIHEGFGPIIDHFTAAARDAFETRLAALSAGIDAQESELVRAALTQALYENARLKLNRVLLLELHAAKLGGELTAEDEPGRFAQFVAKTLRSEFTELLHHRYPPLLERLQRALGQQCAAIETLVARLIADRAALAELLGAAPGRLIKLSLGQGDLHDGGQTVARLTFEAGQVMYKPRSLRIDAVFDEFLAHIFEGALRIRVPAVLDRGDYGWATFIEHRYCENDDELRVFYRGLGHWLAVLRLLGGTDIHLENLVAAGPVPTVVDVESLFAAAHPVAPSNYGRAYDLAQTLILSSVLRTGIVPFRSRALGFGRADLSAAGSLPGEQPQLQVPVIADDGTTAARVELVEADMATSQNHPSPNPDVSRYWDDITDAFLEASLRLRELDAEGRLVPLLSAFEGCRAREVRRATQIYVEIGRMLWHPASLHEEAKAIERARTLFSGSTAGMAPTQQEIAGEIDDLRYGDIPIFVVSLTPERIAETLDNWRTMRIELEEMTIRSSLVVTQLNSGTDGPGQRDSRSHFARRPHRDKLDQRRRKLAAETTERLLRLAVRGEDGSVTWITPESFGDKGWHVQPLGADGYFGLGGVAVALAGYRHEVENGRADPVAGVDEALEGALLALQTFIDAEAPATVGGFTGDGSRIWAWLVLHDLLGRPELLANACACAAALERKGFEDDRSLDITDGSCGAIAPLLGLAEATADPCWLALAARAAAHLESKARTDEQGTYWQTLELADPIGGFAHGGYGIGWALARLARTDAGSQAERRRWNELAVAAFAFQDSLFDASAGNWRDIRIKDAVNFPTWCNGGVGIGLAAADLYARSGDPRDLRDMRRAVAASRGQWGFTHTLCHGDFSLWELLVRASMLDPDASAIDHDEATAQVVSAIEEHGIVGGITRQAFTPGLMTGLAGAIHGLNRMHPDCDLASPLLLECKRTAAPKASVATTLEALAIS
ncbi:MULTISPECIES: type 2 lanthipeptide synthetase LanM family protein [unclassified Lysobacter]|uniref:type 2 lanthipeptide synthetase LanM family protein n=1 Tax=unclassified Lysobacter TaxID=2635362 RepID=UPI0006F52C66|nr:MULTISPECIES: type 2 lanthipeptide synthetase LanM family protein [unclassified Lysobacter]KQZ68000.1 lanthionine synthetase [Lysobacter sp. Root559]KRC38326.1 lanthionine synthetase [Lysobacter sp. Root76]KRD69650.1 lanthionine synthetase [Lysobacter sp. Root96]